MKVTLSPLKSSLKILKGSLGSLTWDSWLVMSRHLAVKKFKCICQFEQWKETCLFVWVNYTTRVKTRAIMNLCPAFSKGLWHCPEKTQAVFFLVMASSASRLGDLFFPFRTLLICWFLGPPPCGTTQRVDEIIYDGRSTYPLRTPEARTPESSRGSLMT